MYLNTHSYFSLGHGTQSPEELVAAAARQGIRRLALTDINNTSGAYPFYRACRAAGIEPVLGIEFRQKEQFYYVGLAENEEGWRALCALATEHSASGTLPRIAPAMDHVYFIYRETVKAPEAFRNNEFLGLRPAEVHRVLRTEWKHHKDRLIAFESIFFATEADYRLHRLLRCVDQNLIISRLRAEQCAPASSHWRSAAQVQQHWITYPQLLLRAEALLESCEIDLSVGKHNNRQCFTHSTTEDIQLLRKLAYSGCMRRYGGEDTKAWARLEQELAVIERMEFPAYFLITWDIVRYAQSMGYHHVGRGSGANSLVAYCMYITDVDPMALDLYFERFINPHRASPPDFDIDFSWDERDDVTDYIFKRYGAEYTALLATYNTYKGRSIIRELGKVVGLPKADIDRIIAHPRDKGHHPYAQIIQSYGQRLEGMPHYLSIHAGGILIGERSLHHHTALKHMPKGFPITHFDMYTAEDLAFHKFDILSQRGLGHIKSAVQLVRETQGKAIDIHNISRIVEDPQVKAQLAGGSCIGCFYIESPAMRGLLHKLSCDNYKHLVAASSIIRPGVAQSGMMRAYIERTHQPEDVEYIHPVFEQHLQETYGIIVYQEDVMKIVHHFAGLDLDESDILRRIMSGKRKSGDTFQQLREKYFRNCTARGYSKELSEEVWRQIESFSGYSFCKAHSASFAVESFQSLYLKAHYPLEFIVGVINNFGGFYRTEIYVHEARTMGAEIHAPCVNHSKLLTHLYGKEIYLGFIHLKSLDRAAAQRIEKERERGGEYKDLADFLHRVEIGKESAQILVRIGAFRYTGKTKCALLWELQGIYQTQRATRGQPLLFQSPVGEYQLPDLQQTAYEEAMDEIELLGFPLCSPFELVSAKMPALSADRLESHLGKRVRIAGYFVTTKPVRTVNGKRMSFGCWLDRAGAFFDTVHFPEVHHRYPIRGLGCYLIEGKVVEDFGLYSIEVSYVRPLARVKEYKAEVKSRKAEV